MLLPTCYRFAGQGGRSIPIWSETPVALVGRRRLVKLFLRHLSNRSLSRRKTKTCFASSQSLLHCRLLQHIGNWIWLRSICTHFLLQTSMGYISTALDTCGNVVNGGCSTKRAANCVKCMCSTILRRCRSIQRLKGAELAHHCCVLRFKSPHSLVVLSLNSLRFFQLVVEWGKFIFHFFKALLNCCSQVFSRRLQLQ